MQFNVERDSVLATLKSLTDVSTSSISPDYAFAGKITIENADSSVFMSTSNGFLSVKSTIKLSSTDSKDSVPGKCTVDSVKLKEIVEKIDVSSKTLILSFQIIDNFLVIQGIGSKSKRKVKIPVLNEHHSIDSKVPSKIQKNSIPSQFFSKITNTVCPFAGIRYKPEYALLCMDFYPDQSVFVCGDGVLFCVAKIHDFKCNVDSHVRRLLPVDQVYLIEKFCSGSQSVDFYFKNNNTVYIYCNNTEMVLKGIPSMNYISYENHAFKQDHAKWVIDISKDDLRSSIDLINTVEDKDVQDAMYFLSCHLNSSTENNKLLEMRVDEKNKYQCEVQTPCNFYDLSGTGKFHAECAVHTLKSIVKKCDKSFVRFYCIDENGLMNAETIDLMENKDNLGMFIQKTPEDNFFVSFFFATVKDE